MPPVRAIAIWGALALAVAAPIAAAMASPLLAWRQPIYIAAGFAGIISLGLLLVQPLLISGTLPGLSPFQRRRVHRWVGGILVLAVVVHVAGLWMTSPPDVIDALLFRAPTSFSVWGVVAMWGVFVTALWAIFRRRLLVRQRIWRAGHMSLALVIVIGTVAHAMLIEGTMEMVSKTVLCVLVIAATLKAVADLWVWTGRAKPR